MWNIFQAIVFMFERNTTKFVNTGGEGGGRPWAGGGRGEEGLIEKDLAK
jgi:hypothetical protein